MGRVSSSELRRLLSVASIFALLFEWEGLSIARLEAMALGVPVLSSDAGCGRDLTAMGGRVFPIDHEQAAGALRDLAVNGELRASMAARQRASVLS